MSEKPILGILLGNSAGVGPELVAMLAVKDYYKDYCRPVIIGDLRMFEHGLKVVGGTYPTTWSAISASAIGPRASPCWT